MMGGMMELDGRPASAEDLRSLALCNYGHFTSMRVEEMRVRGLALHLDRLVNDCQAMFGVPLDPDRVRHLARRAAESAERAVIVRVTVFDPELDLGRPAAVDEPHILVTTRTAASGDPPPLRLATTRYDRDLPGVKHVGLLATLYHRRQSQLDGYDDVLFVNSASRVSEGATWNIAFVDSGRVLWPDADCLPGVTMQLVKDLLHQAGIPSDTTPIEPVDLPRFRSAFITNAAVGLRSISAINEQPFVEDPSLMSLLRKEYAAIPGDPL